MAQATMFDDDPAAQAAIFERPGLSWLHVVDLDGAFAGKPMNAAAVEAILGRVTMPVQLGGGIRDMRTIEAWLAKGVARVIIGTAAVSDPDSCARRRGCIPAGSRSGSTPATAWWRSRGGRETSHVCATTSAGASRMPASRPSSTRTSPATASSRG